MVMRLDKSSTVHLERAKDVMQFTDYPPAIAIRNLQKASLKGGACPDEKEGSCHFLIESESICFYSCPL